MILESHFSSSIYSNYSKGVCAPSGNGQFITTLMGCCSENMSVYEMRMSTLLSHVYWGIMLQESKHKIIGQNLLDRFNVLGKEAETTHKKIKKTLWKHSPVIYHFASLSSNPTHWQAHWTPGENSSSSTCLLTPSVFLPLCICFLVSYS